MSFLDKAKAKAEETSAEKKVSRPNPFARKNPFAKKEAVVKEDSTEESTKKVEEKVKTEEKKVVKKETTKDEPKTKQETEDKPKDSIKLPKKEKEEVEDKVLESDKEAQKEKQEEPKKKSDPKTKSTKKPEAKPKEKPAEKKQPKKEYPKENSKPKKKASSKETTEEKVSYYKIPTTEMSYIEAIESIRSPFVDEEWENFKEEIMSDIGSVEISDDLNPGMLKVVVAELSIIREKLWIPHQEAKNQLESLSSKEPEGLIERVKRVNMVGGSNDAERRRLGITACMNYESRNGLINLYEILDDTRSRFNFLKAAMDTVKYKTDVLITMNGALKLEKEHL